MNLRGTYPVKERVVILSSGLYLFHYFSGNLHPVCCGLVMDPTPKFRNLIEWVIGTVGRDEYVCIEEVEHLLSTSHSHSVDQGVYVAGFYSEYLSGFRVGEKSFCERILDKSQKRVSEIGRASCR